MPNPWLIFDTYKKLTAFNWLAFCGKYSKSIISTTSFQLVNLSLKCTNTVTTNLPARQLGLVPINQYMYIVIHMYNYVYIYIYLYIYINTYTMMNSVYNMYIEYVGPEPFFMSYLSPARSVRKRAACFITWSQISAGSTWRRDMMEQIWTISQKYV